MCGIAGVVEPAGKAADQELLEQMCLAIRHRGPDSQGIYIDGNAGLGIRRLRIIDITTGDQPIHNEDRSVWVVFNGEIYNYPELRQELEARGHHFYTRSDTETVVHAYEEYGEECIRRLDGMFALALWDTRRRRLLLARDRVGKKPLLYYHREGRLVFGSEFNALLQDPSIPREVNLDSLDFYLTYGYVPAPDSAFSAISKLPPAHYLVYEEGRARLTRYWQLRAAPKLDLSEAEAREGFMERLRRAVKVRLMSDVPLGAFLSGGLDSSTVVALMSELSAGPVKTFSIGFEEREYSELPYAAAVAGRFGTDHHEFVVRPDALEVLPTLALHYGEPYADSSAVPSYYVARLTREHVTVALNGDGGDESLAGYERYLAARLGELYRRLPRLLREEVVAPLARALPDSLDFKNRSRRLRRFLEVAGQPLEDGYRHWMSVFSDRQRAALWAPEFARSHVAGAPERWLNAAMAAAGETDLVSRLMLADIQTYLPEDLLVKMDIASMTHSLEARSPFLDYQLMEFLAALPSHLKLRGFTSKHLLRTAMADVLPPSNLRRGKMGFGVPVGTWFRGDLRELVNDMLLSPRALQRPYFKPEALRGLVHEHLEGTRDHGARIWALLMLEQWHRAFIDGDRAGAAPRHARVVSLSTSG